MSKWMTKGERPSYLSSAAPSLRSIRLWRMLTGKSAIPIDAAMHKRSAENVNKMVADLQRGGRTFKARAAVIIWSQSTLRINGKKTDPGA